MARKASGVSCSPPRYGKEQADERVERALYQRAIGFEYPAVKISFNKDGNPLFAQYREFHPPDTAAAKHWLNNRRPADWRERTVSEHTGANGGPIQLVSSIPRPPKE